MPELWERQKGERDITYTYFSIYLQELKVLPKKLQDVIDYIENLPSDGHLKKYKTNLIKVPTLTQLQHMSSKWNWQDREKAYLNHLDQKDREMDEERYNETNDNIRSGLEQDLKEIDQYSKELYDSDYKLSTKINLKYTLARARDLTIKNLRLSHGRSTSISESNDKVKVDAELQYSGLKDLAEAFNEGKRKYLKKQ